MATVSISISGTTIVNGSKSYTISDAHVQRLLTWAQAVYSSGLSSSPTNVQIALAWIQGWVTASSNSEKQFSTLPPTIPPPIIFSS